MIGERVLCPDGFGNVKTADFKSDQFVIDTDNFGPKTHYLADLRLEFPAKTHLDDTNKKHLTKMEFVANNN